MSYPDPGISRLRWERISGFVGIFSSTSRQLHPIPMTETDQRAMLQATIWRIADEVRTDIKALEAESGRSLDSFIHSLKH